MSSTEQVPDISTAILYEDNHIIAVNKKPSQIVQGDKTGDIPLSDLVKGYLKQKFQKPGEVFLGVVHRIDRPVSGVTLFARTSKALSRLNQMLKNREIHKVYWAVVKNKPPTDSDRLIHFLVRDEAKNKTFVSKEGKKGAQEAILDYRIIGRSDRYFLLEIELHTGRHHQIRAQLAAIGCPIKGDLKYGYARSNENASIHLHARKVTLIHPVQKIPVEIVASPPSDAIWDFFSSSV